MLKRITLLCTVSVWILSIFCQIATHAQSILIKEYTFDSPHSAELSEDERSLLLDPGTVLLSAQAPGGTGYCIVDADNNSSHPTTPSSYMRYEDWVGTCNSPSTSLCSKLLAATTTYIAHDANTSNNFYQSAFLAGRATLEPRDGGPDNVPYPEREVLETSFSIVEGGRYEIVLDVKDLVSTTSDVISSSLDQPVVPIDIRVAIDGTTLAQAPTALYESSAPAGALGQRLRLNFTAPTTTSVTLVVYVRRNRTGYGVNHDEVPASANTIGFWALDNLRIAYSPPLSAPTVDNMEICGTAVTFTVRNPISGATYSWYTTPSGGSPVHTSSSPTYSPIIRNYGPTTYYVSVRNGSETSSRTAVTVTRRQPNNTQEVYNFDYPHSPSIYGQSLVVGGANLNPAWTAGETEVYGYCVVDASGRPSVPINGSNSVRYVEDWLSNCSLSPDLCSTMQQANAALPNNDPFRGSFLASRISLERLTSSDNLQLRSSVEVLERTIPAQAGGHYVIELDVRDLAAYRADSIKSGWDQQPVAFTDIWAVVEHTGLRVTPTDVYTYDPQQEIHGRHLRLDFYAPDQLNTQNFTLIIYAQRHYIAAAEHPAEWINPNKITQGFVGIDNLIINYPSCDWPAPTISNTQLCGQGSITLRATYDSPTSNSALPAGTSFQWYTRAGDGTYTPVTATTSTTTESTLIVASTNGVALPQSLTYYVSVLGGGFESRKVAGTATFLGPSSSSTLSATAGELCQAGNAHVVVNNPLSQVEYYWFTDANAVTEVHRGTVYDFAVTGSTRVYVQAVPNDRAECASVRREVAITVHNPSVTFAVNATVSGPTPYLQNYAIGFTAATGYDSYTWNWGDNTAPQILTTATSTHAYARPGTYTITLTAYKAYPGVAGGGCSATSSVSGVVVIAPLCEIQALSGGRVQQNTRSGALSYVAAADRCVPAVSFECISDLSTIVNEPALKKVVSATATAFADQLVLPTTQSTNPYLAGQWRTTPQASYSFRTSLTPSTNPQNYSFGTFTLLPFDWESSLRARPAAWLTAAIAEQVAPNGDVLQERDPLGIPSAAKFGYGSTDVYRDPRVKHASRLLPYLQAHNADYQSVLFESFESIYPGAIRTGEDNLPLPDDVQLVTCDIREAASTSCFAHTGNTCALLTNRQLNLLPITLTPQLLEQGLLIKVWVRVENYNPVTQIGYVDGLKADGTLLGSVSLTSNTPLPSVVQNGAWLLFETQIRNFGSAALGTSITPRLRFESSVGNVWVDDIRMQPAQAQMTTYVYDPVSLRLMASFDDQHFALRYQYNAEGKLIRKQAETVQGLKTLQETHYHTPASNQVND